MAMELATADRAPEENMKGARAASDSAAKDAVGAETASTSEMMCERRREFQGLRMDRSGGTKLLASRAHGARPGLCQLLDLEEVADTHMPVRLSPTGLADASVPSYQSEVSADISPGRYVEPGQEAWHLPPLPDVNEVSHRFAESASSFGRHLVNLVEENVTRDIRRNLLEQVAGTSMDGEPNVHVSEHETIHVSLPSASIPTNPPTEETTNLSVERAAGLFSSTSTAVMDMGQHFLSVPSTVWNGFVTRVQTTLRGSADDIGWLANSPGYSTVKDGTEDFLKVLEQIGRGIHTLPDTLTYLLVPGLFSNHGPLYFFDTQDHFAKLGLPCHIAKIQSEAAVEKNAREIKEHVQELYKSTCRKVVLLGHSKGGVDAAAACSMFWPELKDKVVGIVLVQSPYGGSPIASDILREGQIADVETRRIIEILISSILKGDIQSLEDLTYEKRKAFLAKHPLPSDVPVISFHTEASRAPRDVSIMSCIGHTQLPWLPGMASDDKEGGRKLYVIVPLSAVMAICALHIELRYKEKSDGLVARKDAEVPGSIVVRPEKKLDHAWMVYAPSRREPNEPDAAQMCEALITLLLNHPLLRKDFPVTRDTEAAQDPNGFLTTDAARSFLADTEVVSEERLEESERSANRNLGPECDVSKVVSSSERREEETHSERHNSDIDRVNADGGRNGLGEVAMGGVESRMDAESSDLQRQLSDMVVLETTAGALQEEINNASILSEQSNESDAGTASPMMAKDVLLPTENPKAKEIG